MAVTHIYEMTDTWNAGGTTFTAIKMDVTDTASAATSLLIDLQVGGASKFKVTKAGAVTASSNIIGVANIFAGNQVAGSAVMTSTQLAFFSRGGISAPSDGVYTWLDNAGTSFNRLQLGGTTSSFPALKRSGAAIAIRLADDSADAALTSLSISTSTAATFHTTTVALTNGAAAATGTLLNAPVAGNPTKWIGINDNGTIRYIPAW